MNVDIDKEKDEQGWPLAAGGAAALVTAERLAFDGRVALLQAVEVVEDLLVLHNDRNAFTNHRPSNCSRCQTLQRARDNARAAATVTAEAVLALQEVPY